MDDDEGKKMDDHDGANDKEENVGDGLVEVGITVEKATDDVAEVSEVVQDVADASDVEPSDVDAADNTKLTAAKEVTDIGDDSSLHVSNLTRNVTKDHLEEIFSSYGEIRNLKLNIGKSVKTLSAIITFKKDRDAEQALINMDGGQIDGNVVKISFVLVSNSKRTTDEDQPLENDSAGKRISTGKDDRPPRKSDKSDSKRTEKVDQSSRRASNPTQISPRMSNAANGKTASDGRDRGPNRDRDRDSARERDRDAGRGDRAVSLRTEDRRAPISSAASHRDRDAVGRYGPSSARDRERDRPRERDVPARRGPVGSADSYYGPPPSSRQGDSGRFADSLKRGRDSSRERDPYGPGKRSAPSAGPRPGDRDRDRSRGRDIRDRDRDRRLGSDRDRDDLKRRRISPPSQSYPTTSTRDRERDREREKERERERLRVRDRGRAGRNRSRSRSSSSRSSSSSSSSSASSKSKRRSRSSSSSSSSSSSRSKSASKSRSASPNSKASSRRSRSRSVSPPKGKPTKSDKRSEKADNS